MNNLSTTIEIMPPRAGSKAAKLVNMLSFKGGVILVRAREAFGWKPHTTTVAMTGLRKRGYKINRIKRNNKDSVYAIHPNEDA